MSQPAARPDREQPHDIADALALRQFTIMARQVRALRWSFVVICGVMAALASRAVPPIFVGSWLALTLAIFAARSAWMARQLRTEAASPHRKIRGALLGNIALGISYGLSAAFMWRLDQTTSAVLTTIAVCSAAGGIAVSGMVPRVYLAYALGIILPFAAVWASFGTAIGATLAVLMGMFLTIQHRYAQRMSETFNESFLIRRENEALVLQLTVARDQAHAANVAKTRFLAAASHDLRQPLHALSLHSSALLLDPRGVDTPEIAAAIAESITNVSTLLDSLLDISKLDAGTLYADRRPIHLSRMLESRGRSFAVLAESKGLRFELDIVPEQIAVTDPVLLERVLRNLVDNAIKFTPRGMVRLALSRHPDHLLLAVADTGVGIPVESQHKVFDEFFQIDRHAQGHAQGLGLGLSIVSRLSKLLGMTVALHSLLHAGTTVTLRLPQGEVTRLAVVPTATAPEAEAINLDGLRVLVLDDEPSICQAMSTLLRRFGCDVATACTVEQARTSALAFRPQLVMADYRIGNAGNGIDAIATLRDDAPELQALLITGDTAPDRLREARDSGLQLLHKPVSAEQLKRALVEMFSTSH